MLGKRLLPGSTGEMLLFWLRVWKSFIHIHLIPSRKWLECRQIRKKKYMLPVHHDLQKNVILEFENSKQRPEIH